MSKAISDRQKRRIRKRVAKQTVDIEVKQKGLRHSASPAGSPLGTSDSPPPISFNFDGTDQSCVYIPIVIYAFVTLLHV